MIEKRAKLFMNGRSQAVRLPKEFRFAGTEVRVRKYGKGVVLEPIPAGALPLVQGGRGSRAVQVEPNSGIPALQGPESVDAV